MFSTPFILTSSPGHLHKAPTDLPNHLWVLTCSCHLQNLYYSDPFLIFFLGRKSIFFFFRYTTPLVNPLQRNTLVEHKNYFTCSWMTSFLTSFFPQGNTFQAALTTNTKTSFVILNYKDIQWTTGVASGGDPKTGLGGTPAHVGGAEGKWDEGNGGTGEEVEL